MVDISYLLSRYIKTKKKKQNSPADTLKCTEYYYSSLVELNNFSHCRHKQTQIESGTVVTVWLELRLARGQHLPKCHITLNNYGVYWFSSSLGPFESVQGKW